MKKENTDSHNPKKISDILFEQKLDKTRLAKMLGVTYQAVDNIDKGVSQPSLATYIKLSKLFGYSLDELILSEPSENVVKIKNLIEDLKYTIKDFSLDIGEPYEDVEKIVNRNAEPSQKIIESICFKYGIEKDEFNKELLEKFAKAQVNKPYIEMAKKIKDKGYDPEKVFKIIASIYDIK